MAVMVIARFEGDVDELPQAYDRAHTLIMSRGGAVPSGELPPPEDAEMTILQLRAIEPPLVRGLS